MLTDATNGNIPLPDRRYFQLNDVCARIAHLSGAGEVVEQLFRDMEDVKVLAEDGGSNHLLSLALSSHFQAQTNALQRLSSSWNPSMHCP